MDKNLIFNKIARLTKASIIITGIATASTSLIANAADNKFTSHTTTHHTQSNNPLKTQNDKVSYTIGYQIGESFKKND